MNFAKIGKSLKLGTIDRPKVLKIALALILSNIFFFLLIGGGESEEEERPMDAGNVALHLEAKILTPLYPGKRVLIVSSELRQKVEGTFRVLQEDGRVTIEVRDEDAEILLKNSTWEIIPPIKNLAFQVRKSGVGHEIRY